MKKEQDGWILPTGEQVPNHRLWMIGSVVLLITLFAQLAHNNRDALAAHARYGETIRAVYSLL
ncbi:MAG: hypothetical protein VX533_05990, partial [Pseudomonadota bacterium]|nr:hypothetical protein [Pseudomonadota bacterium]